MSRKPAVILLDIEGTTTDIHFVTDVLFPYARQHMPAFLADEAGTAAVQAVVPALRALHAAETGTVPGWPEDSGITGAVAYLDFLMEHDRKVTPLKTLQGLLWAQGYADGSLKGHVYPDVPDAFRRWTATGITLAIYSSGSVQAQKLLFAHSIAGNLTPLLSAYFDTTTGGKREAASYQAIADTLQVPASRVLFFSDQPAEIDAAHQAGMQAITVLRRGAGLPPAEIPDFTEASVDRYWA
jgi:enolase-phosphatase E1